MDHFTDYNGLTRDMMQRLFTHAFPVAPARLLGAALFLAGCQSEPVSGQSMGGAPARGDGDSPEGAGGSADGTGSGGSNSAPGAAGSSVGGSGNTGGPSDAPPPNDLDPGDGTNKTGATIVYNGKATDTPAGNTGCHDGTQPNQYFVQFSSVVSPTDVTYVYVTLPKDRIPATRAVFDVADTPEDWVGHDKARLLVLVDGAERGAEGEIWVGMKDGYVEVRFQDVKLRDDESTELNGNTISAAFLCRDPFE